MKKILFVLTAFSLATSAAFACGTPTCTSTPTPKTSTTVTVTGNVNNSIAGTSASMLGQGGTSFASSTASVSELASAAALTASYKDQPANGTIYGSTSTLGSAAATGESTTTGTGQAATNAVAYGTADATSAASLLSKSAGAQLNLAGTANSNNTVGIGYQTAATGDSSFAGAANVDVATNNKFGATGIAQACTVPVNGQITDYKNGSTVTNAPVTNTFASSGNGSASAFSPFNNGTTAVANQTASVTGSFSATK